MGQFRYIGTDALIARGMKACRQAVVISTRELKIKVVTDTPVDSGDLERTTRIWGPYRQGFSVIARVEQGGGLDDGYGVIVHQKWSHIGPARQVKVPLIAHRERHRLILSAAGKAAY